MGESNQEARVELSHVDYLLAELASSAEMGAIPRSVYETLAQRYLARRERLLDQISHKPRRQVMPPPVLQSPTTHLAPPMARDSVTWSPVASPVRERVEWTTILLFLGAFLVIVSSAFFAVVIWDLMGPGAKLAFMSLFTAAFYAAGWWSRTKMQLRTGAVALTTVASAALLLDGWILIDGYALEGLIPWAILLLVCSLVYWATELLLGERFFGVVGAAAQVGWWWLLGDGLALDVPVRLATIAFIALVWQLVSEQTTDESTFAPLAEILLWAAPVVEMLAIFGAHLDGSVYTRGSATGLIPVLVLTACASIVAWRTKLVPETSNKWLAAVPQVAFVVFATGAVARPGGSAGLIGLLAAVAVVQLVAAVALVGSPLIFTSMLIQVLLVLEASSQAGLSPAHTALSAAAVASLASVLARGAGMRRLQRVAPKSSREAAVALEWSSVGGMTLASAAFATIAGIPLAGIVVGRADVLGATGVLAAWALAWIAARRPAARFGGSVWAFYVAAAYMAWSFPGLEGSLYAIGIVGLAALWFGSSFMPSSGRYPDWDEATRWSARGMILAASVVGSLLTLADASYGSWSTALLLVVASLLFACDAFITRESLSSVASAGLCVAAAGFAGLAAVGPVGIDAVVGWWALGCAIGAVLVAAPAGAVGALRGTDRSEKPVPLLGMAAFSAAVFASLLTISPATTFGLSWELVWLPLALLACAWAVCAYLLDTVLAAASVLSAFASLLALLTSLQFDPWSLHTILVIVGLGIVALPFHPDLGPGGRGARLGIALSSAGLTALVITSTLGVVARLLVGRPSSWDIGQHGMAFVLAALSIGCILTAVRWRREKLGYIGGWLVVLALWVEFGALETSWVAAYSTPLAVYIAACGYVYAWSSPGGVHPTSLDVLAVVIGVGAPLLAALAPEAGEEILVSGLAFAVCFAFLTAGVLLKVRWYLFGGVLGFVAIAFYRSLVLFAEFWWLPIGFVGLLMLVVALTWERQRMLVTGARRWLLRSFEGWR